MGRFFARFGSNNSIRFLQKHRVEILLFWQGRETMAAHLVYGYYNLPTVAVQLLVNFSRGSFYFNPAADI